MSEFDALGNPRRPHPSNFADIYPRYGEPRAPSRSPFTNSMYSSKSHASLKDLSTILDNTHLDNRTATSTPSVRHKNDSSISRHAMLTPPADASASDPMLPVRLTKSDNNSQTSILLKSKSEDDVFGERNGVPLYAVSDAETVSVQDNTATPLKSSPLKDENSDPITPENVQGRMPNEHSVFVANLVKDLSDDELRPAVQHVFGQFGACIVKIARDRQHKHPFAIVNYWTDVEAKRAIKEGRGLLVHDRPVRTEQMQAQRTLILCRKTGGSISQEEAQKLLSRYGQIVQVKPTTNEDAVEQGLPEGVKVTFKYYPHCQAALRGFRETEDAPYSVVDPQECRPQPKLQQRGIPRGSNSSYESPNKSNNRAKIPRSTTDLKSIFLGNLPHDVCEEELEEEFAKYGTIKGCDVVRKPILGVRGGLNVFCFIEYETAEQAETAASHEKHIRGRKIRVEPKEYSSRLHTRCPEHLAQEPQVPPIPRHTHHDLPPNGYQPFPYYPPMFMTPQAAYVHQGPTIPNMHLPYHYPTPPNSSIRRRGGGNWYPENSYYVNGSPQGQYGPGYGMDPSAVNGQE